MKGSMVTSIAARWQIGSVLLLFALSGPATAHSMYFGTVTGPDGKPLNGPLYGAKVVATNPTYLVAFVNVNADGTYKELDVEPNGAWTLAVVARGLETAPIATNIPEDQHLEQDFTLKTATPLSLLKSPNPIPLADDIDSASFQDAPEIKINSGENVVIDDTGAWAGPTTVSGRFRVKYSDQAIHLAADVTFQAPRVNNQKAGNLANGNAVEIDFQNDPYLLGRTAADPAHDWQLVVGLGDSPDWWLLGSINAAPAVGGKIEPLASHFMIQDKPTKDGEKFRLDIPWSILLQGDKNGQPIAAPKDMDLGAMDIAIDAADPTADRTKATRKFQLTWSGYDDSSKNPSSLKPVQFSPHP